MAITEYDKRYFESTRGRVVLLLRSAPKTVNELAEELALTDNAVRSHLIALERDGIVTHGEPLKGFRKPHATYVLTEQARDLFAKPYDSLFGRLLGVLKRRMVPSVIKDVLSELGRASAKDIESGGDLDAKLARLTEKLGEMGGQARVVRENGALLVKSESCPFADAVAEHPEMCKMAEAMASEILDLPVRENCDRTGSPKCVFEISAA